MIGVGVGDMLRGVYTSLIPLNGCEFEGPVRGFDLRHRHSRVRRAHEISTVRFVFLQLLKNFFLLS
jgi:hypothetical protein